MANPNPILHTLRLGVKRLNSVLSNKPLAVALTVKASSRPFADEGAKEEVSSSDALNLVVRPGDYIRFVVDDKAAAPEKRELRLEWKSTGRKAWTKAPLTVNTLAQIPSEAGFACERLSWRAVLDLGVNLKLPNQRVSEAGTTVVEIDPDVVVEEC